MLTRAVSVCFDACCLSVCLQVAARLAAAGHNRALWPPAARQEVAELEQQLEVMQVCVCLLRSCLFVGLDKVEEEVWTRYSV